MDVHKITIEGLKVRLFARKIKQFKSLIVIIHSHLEAELYHRSLRKKSFSPTGLMCGRCSLLAVAVKLIAKAAVTHA